MKEYYIYYRGMHINEVMANDAADALKKHLKKFTKGEKGTEVAVPADSTVEQFAYAREQSMKLP